ncbi:Flavin reductase (NADPH) [Blattella germanica]|nr:Flavin reductase (NADPH) [Blattella germanica]
MQKIVIFGSTGGVGLHATEIAVKKGFQVTVLVRNTSRLPEHLQASVKVIVGDVLDESAVNKAVEGQDAVVVILGTGYDLSSTTVMSNGMKNIVSAMKANGLEHVSVCLSAFLFYDDSKVPERFRELNADHQRMLDVIKESGLKWVAVLPPHFTDNTSSKYSISHGSSPGRAIAKCDLASFLLDSLSIPEHYNQLCGIANTA